MDRVVPEVTIGPAATGECVKINIIDPAMATMLYLPHDYLPTKSWPAS